MRLPTINRTEALIFAAGGLVAMALRGAIAVSLDKAEREELARADT